MMTYLGDWFRQLDDELWLFRSGETVRAASAGRHKVARAISVIHKMERRESGGSGALTRRGRVEDWVHHVAARPEVSHPAESRWTRSHRGSDGSCTGFHVQFVSRFSL